MLQLFGDRWGRKSATGPKWVFSHLSEIAVSLANQELRPIKYLLVLLKFSVLTRMILEISMSLLLFLLLVLVGNTFFGGLFIDLPQFLIHTSQSAISFFLLVLTLASLGGLLGD